MASFSTMKVKNTLGFFSINIMCVALITKILVSLRCSVWRKKRIKQIHSRRNEVARASVRQIISLLKICIPGVASVESATIFAIITLLLLRTRLTLKIGRSIGRSGQFLVQKKTKELMFEILDLALLAIPGSIINISVFYVKAILGRSFKQNLQTTLEHEYFEGYNIYKIATQHTLDNPDHRIDQDARLFCDSLSDLFLCVLRPLLDACILSLNLSKIGGYGALALLVSYYIFVSILTTSLQPDFETMIAISEKKEGNLRTNYNKLFQHAEEIAFHAGEEFECEHANKLLKSIISHENKIKKAKWSSGFLDFLLTKYGASCIGYIVSGVVVLDHKDVLSKAELTKLYLQTVQLYIPLSKSIAKLLLVYKKVAAVYSSAHRVEELREMLHKITLSNQKNCANSVSIDENRDEIIFSDIDIVSPSGSTLLKNFSFNIVPGRHVLITGRNGSGKSALVRVISEIWSPAKGTIKKPSLGKMLFLPQRVYLPPGTLRTQMVYPFMEDEMQMRNLEDSEIMRCASALGISQIIQREGGLDVVKNWYKVLSGGERQRIALVRVLIHRPTFVFLDESTSAVPQADEVNLYNELKKAGVTLITISNREGLKKMHNVLLELKGNGVYAISDLS